MYSAQGDIDAFILLYHFHILVHGDLGCPLHHNPMFGAVLMGLQGEATARLNLNTFHLKPSALGKGSEIAPGPLIGGESIGAGVSISPQFIHHCLYVLCLILMRDQDGIVGCNRHNVRQTQADNLGLARLVQIGVFTVNRMGAVF